MDLIVVPILHILTGDSYFGLRGYPRISSTKAIGRMLSANFNQGCIYTDGMFNVQEDKRVKSFLEKFPRTEVCPLFFSASEVKKNKKWKPTSAVSAPEAYKRTYFNVLAANELYFYIGEKWHKAKTTPSHQGESDVKAIIAWLRSNGMTDKAFDHQTVFNIYNNSPGFLDFEKRARQKVKELKDLLFDKAGIIQTLISGGCDSEKLEGWLHSKCGIKYLSQLFPKKDQPTWNDYDSKYGRVWDELVYHLQRSEYNQYLKDDNYGYQFGGSRPMVEIDEIISQLDFTPITIYGKIIQSDGTPAVGIRANFDRDYLIYKGTGFCQQEYTNASGNFNFYYLKRGLDNETRYITAINENDEAAEVKVEIDIHKQKAYYSLITLAGTSCPLGYEFNNITSECEKQCGPNSHATGNGLNQFCECDDGFEWNTDGTTCTEKEEEQPIETAEDSTTPKDDEDESKGEETDDDKTDESGEETAPEISPDYCNAFSNTEPVIDSENGGWACNCISGYVWNEAGTGCITEQESLVERADCKLFPNTAAVWSAQEQAVICDCVSGYEWNDEGICVPNNETAAELADCGDYLNTRPIWSDADDSIVCDCISGYEWKADLTGCELVNETDQCQGAYPNTKAVFNKRDGTYYCECLKGYEWNRDETGCVMTETTALANSTCNTIPNAQPKYNSRTQTTYCICRNGYKWNASGTACINDPAYDQAMNQLVETLVQLGGGNTSGLGGNISSGSGVDSPDNPSVAAEHQHQGECNTNYSGSGDNVAQQYTIPVDPLSSQLSISYELYGVKDRIHAYYNGYKIYDSGCASGSGSTQLQTSGMGGTVAIIIDPRCDSSSNTAWNFTLNCSN